MLYFVADGLINNKPILVQVMVWPQTGDKPLSEPIMAKFTDTYISASQPGIQLSDVPTPLMIGLSFWHARCQVKPLQISPLEETWSFNLRVSDIQMSGSDIMRCYQDSSPYNGHHVTFSTSTRPTATIMLAFDGGPVIGLLPIWWWW